MLDSRMSVTVGRYRCDVNELVSCLKKNEDCVNTSVKASVPLTATVSCCSCHDPFNKKMEGDLCVWPWVSWNAVPTHPR
jgi:hypothetical protein